jgi:hypothetical protein
LAVAPEDGKYHGSAGKLCVSRKQIKPVFKLSFRCLSIRSPEGIEVDFYNDLMEEYLLALPEALKSNGVLEAQFGRIEIEAVKAF